MLEINSNYTYILNHPDKKHEIRISLYDKEAREAWLPYLRYFDEYLVKISSDYGVVEAQ